MKKMELAKIDAKANVTAKTMAESLSQQYDDIGRATSDLVRKVVTFGLALSVAESELTERGLLGNRKDGQGMKGWIEENCPNLNYKTAMRWKSLAARFVENIGCDSETAMGMLDGSIPKRKRIPVIASRIDELCSASSVRQLSQTLFDFSSEEETRIGRPPIGEQAAKRIPRAEAARRMWGALLVSARKNRRAYYSAAKLLALDEAREARAELAGLVSALDARIGETK